MPCGPMGNSACHENFCAIDKAITHGQSGRLWKINANFRGLWKIQVPLLLCQWRLPMKFENIVKDLESEWTFVGPSPIS